MAAEVDLRFDGDVVVEEWLGFCSANGLVFEPRIAVRNVFFRGDLRVVVSGMGTMAKDSRGYVDFASARPPEAFRELRIGSRRDLRPHDVAALARAVAKMFPCRIEPDAGIPHLLVDLPRSWEEGRHFEAGSPLRTDGADGWLRSGDVAASRVGAGRAVIRDGGPLVVLEIEGVVRASFRDEATARLYAGRCGWDLWRGTVPASVAGRRTADGAPER